MRFLTRSALALTLMTSASVLPLAGCGVNYLEDQAPQSPVEEAQLLMEKEEHLEARRVLEEWLSSNPDDAKARALFAATFAAEAGIAIIDLTKKTLEGGAQSDEDLIKSILPQSTDSNLALVRRAKNEIELIPGELRNADIDLEATVYTAAFLLMFLDNLASSNELPSLEEAVELLESLDEAETLARENNIPPQEIEKIRAEINGSDGANDQEKINSYLEKVRAENGGTLPDVPQDTTPP